ncbi:hypothetical protein NC652_022407 [Populus alba x Populus x berolinensis]|nr:hypothetical protein NC652_022407 [Populus alba x Populus x berolinensis]
MSFYAPFPSPSPLVDLNHAFQTLVTSDAEWASCSQNWLHVATNNLASWKLVGLFLTDTCACSSSGGQS